jgi:hypothetical protein
VRTRSHAKDRERVGRAGGAWDARGEERRTNVRHVERGRTSRRHNNVGVAHTGERVRSRGDTDLADGNIEACEQRSSSHNRGAGTRRRQGSGIEEARRQENHEEKRCTWAGASEGPRAWVGRGARNRGAPSPGEGDRTRGTGAPRGGCRGSRH